MSQQENITVTASIFKKCLNEEQEMLDSILNSLYKLRNLLIVEYPNNFLHPANMDPAQRKNILKRKIEDVFTTFIQQIARREMPVIRIRNGKSWSNCIFQNKLCLKSMNECVKKEIKLTNAASLPKFALIHFLLAKIYILIATDETCTKRELFYQNLEYIDSQTMLDSVLNDITCLLNVPLCDLNIYATSKGLIAGPVIIRTYTNQIHCEGNQGTLIPNDICNIIGFETNAKFVLVIEKDAVFQKLLNNEAMKKLPPCIFITGKGFPDINTRLLLKKMWQLLTIPILALVDADPWGIEIMCVYRFGSLTMSHQAEQLAVPSIRWMGIYPTEISALCDRSIPLSNMDKDKINDLLMRPYILTNEKLKYELTFMFMQSKKAEMEAMEFANGYLAKTYIPKRIAGGDFI